jgi:hypothetical protein
MSLARRATFIGKSAALWVFMTIAVLCVSLGALGFFVAAFVIWLSHYLGPAAGAAITGVLLLMIACVIGGSFILILRRMRARQPSLLSETLGSFSFVLQFVTLIIRRDPRKAVLAALVAGALAEYFSSEGRSNS